MAKQKSETHRQYMGGVMRDVRKQNGFSQEAFSEKLAISQHAMSELETGKRFPRTETLIRFTRYYDGNLAELFTQLNAYLDAEDKDKEW